MAETSLTRKTRRSSSRYGWTRRQYERIVEAGVLGDDDRVELINGEILEMSPHGSRHYLSVHLLAEQLRGVYGAEWHVRAQAPLALDPDSEPEPDLAVVAGNPRDYRDQHPTSALLVVEVSDATLQRDRKLKATLYARHGVPEYWIVNLTDACIEVYRAPASGTFQTKLTLRRGESVQPQGATRSIAVADVLP